MEHAKLTIESMFPNSLAVSMSVQVSRYTAADLEHPRLPVRVDVPEQLPNAHILWQQRLLEGGQMVAVSKWSWLEELNHACRVRGGLNAVPRGSLPAGELLITCMRQWA